MHIYLNSLSKLSIKQTKEREKMTSVMENNVVQRRRGSRSQLSRPVSDHDMLHDNSIISEHNWFCNNIGGVFSLLGNNTTMNKSVKTALIAIAILVCVIAVILLLSLRSSDACIKLGETEETCHAKQSFPYRMYGTKTAYHVVSGNLSSGPNVEGCTPKVFYLFSRHATRYPDEEDIEEMIKLLPDLQNRMLNNSHMVKMCKEDLQNLKNWVEKMKPEDDNKMSSTGEAETILLAQHFKSHLPTLLGEKYSPEKFKFEFTSRERTRSTAESFAQGLFGDKFKEINFDDSINDMLQFHKECKVMQKRCKYQGYDTSEIDKFVNGTWMQKVTESVSARIGVPLSYDDLKTIYKACVFGYALNTGDVWCSLFTSDELKVIEFGEDIDDYYKDAYGNKINYEQACPVVEDIMDLFKTYTNTSKSKVLLQFSHAGGIKKVYSIFGLFKDEDPLKADGICSQENRKWRSSMIAPFTSNLALILYECGTDLKIAAFLNEKPVKLGGCSDLFCSYEEFLEVYNPIAEECDLKKICCTCCRD